MIHRSKPFFLTLLVSLIALAFFCSSRAADAADPGSFAGSVKYDGDIARSWIGGQPSPVLTPLPAGANPDAASMKPPRQISMTAEGAVENVAIWLESPEAAAAAKARAAETMEVDQKGSVFIPYTSIVPVGTKLIFKNSDGINHNVRLTSKIHEQNFYLSAGQDKPVTTRKPDNIQIVCDLHAWMRAAIYVVETPYFAVTDADGKFSIAGVPPGTYRVRIGHHRLAPAEPEMSVTIEPGKASEAEIHVALGGR